LAGPLDNSGAPRKRLGRLMASSAETHYFTPEAVETWSRIAAKHRLRDEQFLRVLAKWFRPGSILEIGAATGQLSQILQSRGHDVLASDLSPALVAAIKARGVPATIVDASRDIRAQTGRSFANILAQGVLPLILRDRERVYTTLAAIHGALDAGGRLICISPRAQGRGQVHDYLAPREQLEIAKGTGLFRFVTAFPHQVIPTGWYRTWNARAFNALDFHAAHLFAIRLVWVMEKIDSRGDAGPVTDHSNSVRR
jgi:SAM-dependent methyltransferase